MSDRHAALADIAELNPRLAARLAPHAKVSFVPMSSVSADSATVELPEVRAFADVSKGYTSFLSGDVLVAKITPCFENGKIAHARLPLAHGFGSTEFHVVRPRGDAVDARYLLHFLRQDSVRAAGTRRMTGSAGQRRVPESFLAGLQIPLPSVDKQRRIAAILDQAEALRAQRRAAIAQLDSLGQAIFVEMFGDPAINQKRWDVKTIEELCEVKGGKRLPKGAEYSPTPTPHRYIRVTNLSNGHVDQSQLLYLAPGVQKLIGRYIVNTGDVIISIAGSIGLVAPVPTSLDGANLTENAAKLVQRRRGDYLPDFLAFMLGTRSIQGQIQSHVGQVTIGKLALFRIEKLQVPLPPLPLQQTFASRIASIEALKATHRRALAALDALFASLQQRAFAGGVAGCRPGDVSPAGTGAL